ncbi:MAG: polyphosphate--nucleotide phosphotransferase [Salinivirgaceae bacterium]|nr:MAG: polyphosphate--nucleotide phosphotransferase [Salinivirgaceae bacterium]
MSNKKFIPELFKISPKQSFQLKDFDPDYCDGFKDEKEAKKQLKKDIKLMSKLQYKLYAENKKSLLIVFQAMDAAGKDGAIKHIFSGVNPQGCQVHSFKQPSSNELQHDYLWRHYKKLPERGRIGIFNRSHYENVLITKVHPEFILNENLPEIKSVSDINDNFWDKRYQQINNFEKSISENGTTILKFFLNVSKKEQKNRFLERIENEEKNWKFSSSDMKEREFWNDYQKAYEHAIKKTSTEIAPWYVIPANNKWFTRVAIGKIVVDTLINMNCKVPEISDDERSELKKAKKLLNKE